MTDKGLPYTFAKGRRKDRHAIAYNLSRAPVALCGEKGNNEFYYWNHYVRGPVTCEKCLRLMADKES